MVVALGSNLQVASNGFGCIANAAVPPPRRQLKLLACGAVEKAHSAWRTVIHAGSMQVRIFSRRLNVGGLGLEVRVGLSGKDHRGVLGVFV